MLSRTQAKTPHPHPLLSEERESKARVRRPGRAQTPRTVAAYLAELPMDARAALKKLRKTIKATAPDAIEGISYGMPAFKHKGQLVYYAAFKDHCSFFPASVAVMRRFATELKGYDTTGKGTIRFPASKPLPAALVTKLVRARVAENEARQTNRKR
jgi:uncharacterized protein YdhG (YjbR/CyaY superfamily)